MVRIVAWWLLVLSVMPSYSLAQSVNVSQKNEDHVIKGSVKSQDQPLHAKSKVTLERAAPVPSVVHNAINNKNTTDQDVIDGEGELLDALNGFSISDKAANAMPSIAMKLHQAYEAYAVGQVESAIVLYKQILVTHPKQEDALFALAGLYQKQGFRSKAHELYIQLLTMKPKHRDALHNLLAMLADEEPVRAMRLLKELSILNPHFSPIIAQLAAIAAKSGKWTEAIHYYRQAVKINPTNMEYRYNLAVSLDHNGQKSEALAYYRELQEAALRGEILPVARPLLETRIHHLSLGKYSQSLSAY
jgi:tetratricopeptide (TPR) repeat protein